MVSTALLVQRLGEIGAALAGSGRALALIALGSAGREIDRLDEYSDLDFFAIVKPGEKAAFLADLGWLTSLAPVAYAFRNTADGYKLLYEDGVFCEFAVFVPAELENVAFAPGRIFWRSPELDEAALVPRAMPGRAPLDVPWQVGEALTNLYVGLGRFRRGERLSAARLVQGFAVDRVLELAVVVEEEIATSLDPFSDERRVEQRFPLTAARLAEFIQGYDRTPESARAILGFLDEIATTPRAMRTAILELIDLPGGSGPLADA